MVVITINSSIVLSIFFWLVVPLAAWTMIQFAWSSQENTLTRGRSASQPGNWREVLQKVGQFLVYLLRALVNLPSKISELIDSLDQDPSVPTNSTSYQHHSRRYPANEIIEIKNTPMPERCGDHAFLQIKHGLNERRRAPMSSDWLSVEASPSSATSIKEEYNKRSIFVELDGHLFEVMRRQVGFVTIACFRADWTDPTFRLKLYEETEAEREKCFRGMQDIQVGRQPFDRSYVIQSNDPHLLSELLTPAVQDALMVLGKSVNFSIAGGRVMLEFIDDFRTFADGKKIVQALHQFSKVYGLLLESDGGSVFSSIESNIDQANACCMVCGQSIESAPVTCVNCQTAHHSECWEYLGKCSTFACGSVECK